LLSLFFLKKEQSGKEKQLNNTSEMKKTSIGGSALIEGVMMKGPHKLGMGLRKPDGTIEEVVWELPQKEKPWYMTTPIIRGVFNFVDSMKFSYKCLSYSAEVAGFEDEEPSKFEIKLKELLGDKFASFLNGIALVLGVLLAVAIFFVIPTTIVGFLRRFIEWQAALTLIEAVVKIGIFVVYVAVISRMEEIKRVFEYHGAEHKTISCYEAGEELTVENVRRHSRFHPRCGTSFIIITLIVSVLVSSLISWSNVLIRIALKVITLPIVMGVAYEAIKFAGRSESCVAGWLSKPGIWMQHLTTREPDDGQIECAIAAMKPCIPENSEDDRW